MNEVTFVWSMRWQQRNNEYIWFKCFQQSNRYFSHFLFLSHSLCISLSLAYAYLDFFEDKKHQQF